MGPRGRMRRRHTNKLQTFFRYLWVAVIKLNLGGGVKDENAVRAGCLLHYAVFVQLQIVWHVQVVIKQPIEIHAAKRVEISSWLEGRLLVVD